MPRFNSPSKTIYLRLDLIALGFRKIAPSLARIDPHDEESDPFGIVILFS